MKITLQARENEETGEMGWLPQGMYPGIYQPSADPATLAHDLLEHTAYETVADEMQAIGAAYRIRYEGGWGGYGPWGRHLRTDDFGADWISLYYALNNESCIPTPSKTRPLDSYIESDIDSIIEKGKETIVQEVGDEGGYENDLGRIEEVFRAYFRIGYRNVGKRFRGMRNHDIANLFNTVADAFKHNKPQFEYQEITVNISPKTGTVKIREKEVDEYGY